jgi:hypothetical protein
VLQHFCKAGTIIVRLLLWRLLVGLLMRYRILQFTLRDVSIPQQFIPKAAKFSPERKLRIFGTIFNKDRLASTRRFKRGPQGICDAHASAFLTLWEETQGSSDLAPVCGHC